MRRKIFIVGSIGLLIAGMNGIAGAAGTAPTEPSAMTTNMQVFANLNGIKWGPQSDALPPGGNLAVLVGNPSSSGFVSLRAKLPAGYTVPPHFHPTDLHVTVNRGGYFVEPAQMHHYVVAKAASVIQIDLDGPFAITYVNPSDDPRNKKVAK